MATGVLTELPWTSPKPALDLPSGTVLDERYRLESEIGRGGFGAVFQAVDEATDDTVAVKVLTGVGQRLVERMGREIAVLRRLSLPCVVEFLDEGEHDGQPYIVMPFVKGDPFPGSVPRTWDSLGSRLLALVEAVARVHTAGVLHRDLKPDNVLWVGAHPVLLDFGLAVSDRLVLDDEDLAGSPAYLSPEQYVGSEPDTRSDLYSLGVVAYQALSGELPFPGRTLFEVVEAVLTREPPPLHERCDAPRPVCDLITQLLARDPGDRPSNAAKVARRIRPHVADASVELSTPARGTPTTLQAVFRGPELAHHLRSDPAQVLWERTGGRAKAVRRTLGAWVRAGMAEVAADGTVTMQRDDVDRLLAGLVVDPCRGAPPQGPLPVRQQEVWTWVDLLGPWASDDRVATAMSCPLAEVRDAVAALCERGLLLRADDRLRALVSPPPVPDPARRHGVAARLVPHDDDAHVAHLLAAHHVEEVPAAALDVVRARVEEGALHRAWAVAQEGLVMERRLGAHDDQLLELSAHVALQGGHRAWLAAVARDAARRRRHELADFLKLAARCLVEPVEPEAFARIDLSTYPLLRPWVDRLTAYVVQSAPVDAHERFLTGTKPEPEAAAEERMNWLRWQARLWLRQERVRDALAASEQAFELATAPHDRTSLAITVAELLIECGLFERAEAWLHTIQADVRALRVPVFELLLEHHRHAVAYRSGQPVVVHAEFEEATERLQAPAYVAPWWLQLAASAWRSGDLLSCSTYASYAAGAWPVGSPAWAVARGLELLARDQAPTPDEYHRLQHASTTGPVGLIAQSRALLRIGGITLPATPWAQWRARLLTMQYPPSAPREVLSLEEIAAALEDG
jgi:hypothetical protein